MDKELSMIMSAISDVNTFRREVEIESRQSVLSIHQCEVGDVGCVVWDAAIVLAKYLDFKCSQSGLFLNKNVLELGAGTGLVGLVAVCLGYVPFNSFQERYFGRIAVYGLCATTQMLLETLKLAEPDIKANVVLSDLPEVLPLLELNIKTNQKALPAASTVRAEVLKWGETENRIMKPDIILISDCVYYKESVTPLVKTICDLSGSHTEVFISYEDRDLGNKEELQTMFLDLLKKEFTIEKIPNSELHPEFNSSDIHVLRLKKRVRCKPTE